MEGFKEVVREQLALDLPVDKWAMEEGIVDVDHLRSVIGFRS